MAKTAVTMTYFGDMSVANPESLREPPFIEHAGHIWTVKLQNTFLVNSAGIVYILAVWEICEVAGKVGAPELHFSLEEIAARDTIGGRREER